MKTFIRKYLPDFWFKFLKGIYWNYLDGSSFRSFSGEGEDMILRKIFYKKNEGFYVDVGAYHPKKSSNTYYFYKKGWKGINIDAMPGSMKLFNRFRPNDINIETPVGIEDELISYYEFEDKALNGFETEILKSKDQLKTQNKIKKIHELKSRSLNFILEESLRKDQKIDFLSIDVEGSELRILSGLDLVKYKPEWILIEIWNFEIGEFSNNPVDKFLRAAGYFPKAKTINTVFYSNKV